MKKAYIAGPLFDDHEREYLVKIAEIVESFGFNTFLPHRDAGLVTGDFTFEKNTSSIKYIGKKANNDLAKYNLKNIKKSFSSPITKINFNKYFWEITLEDKNVGKLLINSKNPFALLKLENKKFNFDVDLKCGDANIRAIKPSWI